MNEARSSFVRSTCLPFAVARNSNKPLHMTHDELDNPTRAGVPKVDGMSTDVARQSTAAQMPGNTPQVIGHPKRCEGIPLDPKVFSCRLAFSVKEVALILGVSEKTVRRLVQRGLLRSSRALRHLRITRAEIEKFLERTTPI